MTIDRKCAVTECENRVTGKAKTCSPACRMALSRQGGEPRADPSLTKALRELSDVADPLGSKGEYPGARIARLEAEHAREARRSRARRAQTPRGAVLVVSSDLGEQMATPEEAKAIREECESRLLDTLAELSIGVECPSLVAAYRYPDHTIKHMALPAEAVEGVYEGIRDHYRRLGDFSTLGRLRGERNHWRRRAEKAEAELKRHNVPREGD